MPRKNTMRDHVQTVRSRLPHLNDLTREQIELALLHYELNIDETVNAFNRNGAIEALSGWSKTNSNRRNGGGSFKNNKNTNNQSVKRPSNGILRPSQRVSNLFQAFADGEMPIPSPISSTENHDSKIEQSPIPLDDVFINQTIEQAKPQRRNNSSTDIPQPLISNNKKLLTKSIKDLQRQTSTLTNVELSFNNEIKSSIKHIDDVFKQLHEILKEREIELYLEIDHVKEHGLNVIHRRQQRAIELRQRIDRCDRLQSNEIDQLRTDIKQFVTDRRYELREELTSSHRFDYDKNLVEKLKTFGHVLKIDRRSSTIENNHLNEQNSPSTMSMVSDKVFHDENSINCHAQNSNRRRLFSQETPTAFNYHNGNQRRNGRVNSLNPNETIKTYRRPPPPHSVQN